jgi:hypothetical protein
LLIRLFSIWFIFLRKKEKKWKILILKQGPRFVEMREIYIEEPSSSEPNEGNCSLFFYCLACIHVDILRLICWARSIYSQASPLQFLYDSIYPQFNSLQTCNTVLNILGKTVMKVFFSFQVILVKTAANLAWHCKSCLACMILQNMPYMILQNMPCMTLQCNPKDCAISS